MGDAEEEGFGDVTKHVTACESREGVAANGSGSRKQPPGRRQPSLERARPWRTLN